MLEVRYENVKPDLDSDLGIYYRSYEEDLFSLVENVFEGDLFVETDDHTIKINNIKLLKFSSALFWRAFVMNFRGSRSARINNHFGTDSSITLLEKDGDRVRMKFLISGGRHITVDNRDYISGEDMTFDFRLSVFNEMCGALLEKNIEVLQEGFGDIDGIREYFETIPFAEGYEDKF